MAAGATKDELSQLAHKKPAIATSLQDTNTVQSTR